MVERGSGGGVSLWELCKGNLEGGLPCWNPERGGFSGQISLSLGALLGNL